VTRAEQLPMTTQAAKWYSFLGLAWIWMILRSIRRRAGVIFHNFEIRECVAPFFIANFDK
jgi:hypothetical protein